MAQKYIIGDLVKYKVGGLEFIAEITNTSKYGYLFKGVSDDISGTLCKEFAKDIPLTSEILEKNGWELDNATWIYKKGYIRVFILLDDKTYAAYILGVRVFEFHFIHELQHLLFGLGLNSEMEV